MAAKTASLPQETVKKKGLTIHDLTPYLYILPSLLLFIAFVFYPFVKTIVLSFAQTDKTGAIVSMVGFDNFVYQLAGAGSMEFWNSIWVTTKYALMVVAGSIVCGVFVAILANESFRGRGLVRTIYAMPMAISSACITVIIIICLNPKGGILNEILGTDIKWLKDSKYALPSIAVVTIWMNIGMNYIFSIAALQSVDISLYEAGSLEGVNFFQKHWYITLPCISPTLLFLLIVNIINAFQAYAQVRLMTNGGPGQATRTIVLSIFRETFENNRYNMGATQSVCLFIILFILTAIQMKLDKKVTY